ncbi:MAG: hypothetical protein V4616_10470 [Bacteroidota bacterium]
MNFIPANQKYGRGTLIFVLSGIGFYLAYSQCSMAMHNFVISGQYDADLSKGQHMIDVSNWLSLCFGVITSFIADRWIGHRKTVLAACAVGISASLSWLYIPEYGHHYCMFAADFAYAAFIPAMAAQFGRYLLFRPALLAGGFTLFFQVLSIMGWCGFLFLNNLSNDFTVGMWTIAGLYLCSAAAHWFTPEYAQEEMPEPRKVKRVYLYGVLFFLGMLAYIVFSQYNNAASAVLMTEIPAPQSGDQIFFFFLLLQVILGTILVIYLSYFRTHAVKRVTIGFSLLAAASLLFLLGERDILPIGYFVTETAVLLITIGAVFLTPLMNSIIVKYCDSKYLATVIAGVQLLMSLSYLLVGTFPIPGDALRNIAIALPVPLVFIALLILIKKKTP